MKKASVKFITLTILLYFLSSVQTILAQGFSINESPLPAPTAPVNDFAGIIDDVAENQLNQKIIQFKAKTNPQVVLAVATVRTTGGRPIEEYSLAVGRGWKIGTKEADNPSALLFIAIEDRKYFTLVSKDLQDEIPDGLAGQLQRQYLVPAFKQGDYTKGITDTIDAYIRTIEAKQTNEPIPKSGETKQIKETETSVSSAAFLLCLIVVFFLFLVILSRAAKSQPDRIDRNRWGGGGFGGGGSALPWVIGPIITGGSSGSSSSGDWGSGSSDWGGFGGGGDFDGGGAGGGW